MPDYSISHQNINKDLDSAYQKLAQDVGRELEALEWSEALIVDLGELEGYSDCQSSE